MILVAVGIISNDKNKILITRRAKNAMHGNKWEFPGGKVEFKESVYEALCRELKEEIQITVTAAEPLIQVPYNYGEVSVLLDVWKVIDYTGHVQSGEGQPFRWVSTSKLHQYTFPAANWVIIQHLSNSLRFN